MGKSKKSKVDSAKEFKTFKLSSKRRCTANLYQNEGYLHFRDMFSNKTFSLSMGELTKLTNAAPKILKYINSVQSTEGGDKKKSKSSVSKKRSVKEDRNTDGSDTSVSSSESDSD
jgi:hypothetical protein